MTTFAVCPCSMCKYSNTPLSEEPCSECYYATSSYPMFESVTTKGRAMNIRIWEPGIKPEKGDVLLRLLPFSGEAYVSVVDNAGKEKPEGSIAALNSHGIDRCRGLADFGFTRDALGRIQIDDAPPAVEPVDLRDLRTLCAEQAAALDAQTKRIAELEADVQMLKKRLHDATVDVFMETKRADGLRETLNHALGVIEGLNHSDDADK